MESWTRLRDWAAMGGSFQLIHPNERRHKFIREYRFPAGLRVRFARSHPHLNLSQREEVFLALRQYFLICCHLKGAMAAMPSQIVDDAWHEFILFTREYSDFSRRAFGRFLHHTPAEAMSTPTQAPDQIKRTWRIACRLEKIDPIHPAVLPLIFAIDARLDVPDGFIYHLDCTTGATQPVQSKRTDYCAMHIACGGGCGGSAGSSCGDSGAGCGGSSCGGGCGGVGCGGS